MPAIEVSEVLHELLQYHVKRTEFDTIDAAVETILTHYLMKRDNIDNMHKPFSTILMSCVDDISAVQSLLKSVNWMSVQEDVDKVLESLSISKETLTEHAHRLNKENK